MAPAQRTTTSADGTTIAFEVSGEGPPLVLVGGAFQHRAIDTSTARLAELLSAHLTVHVYDRRGRGDSGDTLPYAVAREVEDLAAMIDAAGGSAFVYGMSSGAALALEATASGLPIERLALYEPPYIPDETRERAPGPTFIELAQAGKRGEAVERFLGDAGVPAEAIAGMRAAPIWPAFEGVAHTLAYDGTIMGDGNVPAERAAKVSVPVLVLDGSASPEWAANAARAVAANVPDARRQTLADQTHDVAPDVLAPVLAEFFAQR
ncbi:alpha/beta fold hydrolase [Conexibacter woesei]|uniref:Alpha/beta hydrolase fold-1 n=1 Tax=Conexibacter woesei (strain DSM 14684 / CCUG 47730 / CIP 108061 / JCM 11494 / NBRC 100937 / ID131577) TaxID=469383 RepID=D3FC00_CONWI|nr:alpha/beta hydrolase [Conexibacter woesei]ADB51415.1 alpha/beta hydrolase fold-1 [Conexibacter woesei DSM 14684]